MQSTSSRPVSSVDSSAVGAWNIRTPDIGPGGSTRFRVAAASMSQISRPLWMLGGKLPYENRDRALRALRAFTSDGVLSKGKGFFSGGAVATAILGTVIILWVGSLSVLVSERGAAGAEIETLPDSLWWAFETITTVGYGDFVPVTWLGRSQAVLIMLVGISLLGVVSASLAATLVKQNKPDPAVEVMTELSELKTMVAALQDQLKQLTPPSQPHP